MTPEELEQRERFYREHSDVRCCDCKYSKPHPCPNEIYTLVCTYHKAEGITVSHEADLRVWCSVYEEGVK